MVAPVALPMMERLPGRLVRAARAINGTQGNQAIKDNATIDPFAHVVIADANPGQTETVTISFTGANGNLTDPNQASDNSVSVPGSGSYTVTGTTTQVSADLDALVFTPTAHQVAPGQTVTTGFTILVQDTPLGQTATDIVTSVVATAVAAPIMLDAVELKNNGATALSGTAEAHSTVSIYDGGTKIGTATAAADGTWSLHAIVSGKVVHSFTEISTDATGYTVSSTGVTLYSPAANKLLQAGSGNDVLIGAPNDTLNGGGGSDIFVFNPGFGKNRIDHFNPSQDVLRFDHTFANLTALEKATHQVGANTVITYDAADTITLIGVSVSQLHFDASHFVLA
jgi:hypothetical protein